MSNSSLAEIEDLAGKLDENPRLLEARVVLGPIRDLRKHLGATNPARGGRAHSYRGCGQVPIAGSPKVAGASAMLLDLRVTPQSLPLRDRRAKSG